MSFKEDRMRHFRKSKKTSVRDEYSKIVREYSIQAQECLNNMKNSEKRMDELLRLVEGWLKKDN